MHKVQGYADKKLIRAKSAWIELILFLWTRAFVLHLVLIIIVSDTIYDNYDISKVISAIFDQ